MAVNYTDLFEDVGEFVQRINQFLTLAVTTLPAYFAEIAAELTGNGRYDVLDGVPATFDSFKDTAVSWCDSMRAKITERLTNSDTVLEQLPLDSGAGISQVLTELIRDMIQNVQTIKKSTVTIGSVTAGATNAGDVTVLTTKTMDGVTQPGLDMPAHPNYSGVDSELAVPSETMTLTCVSDSETDGATEGSESFEWRGQQKGNDFDWRSEGSGTGPTLTVLNGSGLVTNGEFENFTVANTPDNWTINTGVIGTHIRSQAAGASVKRGSFALRLTGDAALAAINLSQNADNGLTTLVPLQRYIVAAWILGTAGTSAGTLTIQFEGTGYTAGGTEKISLNAAALAAMTTYALNSFTVLMPANIPDDMKLVVKWTGTPSAHDVRIDGLVLGNHSWHGGIGVALVAGAAKAIRGDRYTFAVSNNDAGVFQQYMRRAYKVQLPSDSGPSIADSLST